MKPDRPMLEPTLDETFSRIEQLLEQHVAVISDFVLLLAFLTHPHLPAHLRQHSGQFDLHCLDGSRFRLLCTAAGRQQQSQNDQQDAGCSKSLHRSLLF